MSRLQEHLAHIQRDVVKQRGAAQGGLSAEYIAEIEARLAPPLLVRGLEQWNMGHFYAQHETLEFLWRATPDAVRDLFKGIIQSGVGAYHVVNGNRRGALGKWTGAVGYLEPFTESRPYGIEVGQLRQMVLVARMALLEDSAEPPAWAKHRAPLQNWRIEWQGREGAPRVTAWLRRLDAVWSEGPNNVETGLDAGSEAVELMELLQRQLRLKGRQLELLFPNAAPVAAKFEDERTLRRALTHAHDQIRKKVGFLSDADLSLTLESDLAQMIAGDEGLARHLWEGVA